MEYALRAKEFQESINIYTVLILVLMEDALRVLYELVLLLGEGVLILVLMEDALRDYIIYPILFYKI